MATFAQTGQAAADRSKEARIDRYFDMYPIRVRGIVTSVDGVVCHACVDVTTEATDAEIEALLLKDARVSGTVRITERF